VGLAFNSMGASSSPAGPTSVTAVTNRHVSSVTEPAVTPVTQSM